MNVLPYGCNVECNTGLSMGKDCFQA